MKTSSAALDDDTREPADGTGEPVDPAAAAPVGRDRTIRGAALLATLIALPITLLVALLAFTKLTPDTPAAAPTPSATTARVQSTDPVQMAAPALAARPATVCRALLSQLPTGIRDLTQRPVTAGPEQNAAYGDPALTVACGGTEPTFPSTDEVWTVKPGLLAPGRGGRGERPHHGRPGDADHGPCPALVRAAVAVGADDFQHDRGGRALRRRRPVRLPALNRPRGPADRAGPAGGAGWLSAGRRRAAGRCG